MRRPAFGGAVEAPTAVREPRRPAFATSLDTPAARAAALSAGVKPRAIFDAAMRSFDAYSPSAADAAWLATQRERRSRHVKRLAEELGVAPELAARWAQKDEPLRVRVVASRGVTVSPLGADATTALFGNDATFTADLGDGVPYSLTVVQDPSPELVRAAQRGLDTVRETVGVPAGTRVRFFDSPTPVGPAGIGFYDPQSRTVWVAVGPDTVKVAQAVASLLRKTAS